MPDLSRVVRHDDFEDTHILRFPPDVPRPFEPLAGLQLKDHATECPRHSPVSVRFPDPERLERERLTRQRIAAALERQVLGESKRITDAVHFAHKNGLDKGQDIGYRRGWRYGLVQDIFWGAAMVALALLFGARHG